MNRAAFASRASVSPIPDISASAFSHLPVVTAEEICVGTTSISRRPFSVETMFLPDRFA